MYKLSAQIIDFYDDQDLLVDILKSDINGITKTAKILSHEDRDRLSDDDFAVVMITKTGSKIRKFPMNDKAHTWLSCQSFLKTAQRLPSEAIAPAASNLYSSCVYYGIECPKYIKKFASEIDSNTVYIDESKCKPAYVIIKQALVSSSKPSNYGLITQDAKLYPLDSRQDVQMAIRYFDKYASRLIPKYRYELANNIKKAADRYGIDVTEKIANYTHNTIGEECKRNIIERIYCVKTAKEKQLAIKLANTISKYTPDKLISVISDFDSATGIDRFYDSHIKDPYLTVLEKGAAIDRSGEDLVQDTDIEAYAHGPASFELKGKIPEDVIDKFLLDPIKTYNSLPEIQKNVIKQGIMGNLK